MLNAFSAYSQYTELENIHQKIESAIAQILEAHESDPIAIVFSPNTHAIMALAATAPLAAALDSVNWKDESEAMTQLSAGGADE